MESLAGCCFQNFVIKTVFLRSGYETTAAKSSTLHHTSYSQIIHQRWTRRNSALSSLQISENQAHYSLRIILASFNSYVWFKVLETKTEFLKTASESDLTRIQHSVRVMKRKQQQTRSISFVFQWHRKWIMNQNQTNTSNLKMALTDRISA